MISQDSLADRVMHALTDEVLSGRLVPGARVDLAFYASKWNVSITPVRDAVKQMERSGFIRIRARRGVFVTELTAKEVKDIFDVRIALESEAMWLATPHIPKARIEKALRLYVAAGETADEKERNRLLPRIDQLVHIIAAEYCDNPRLQQLLEGIGDMVRWCQTTIIQNLREPFVTTLPEHIAICRAVLDRDPAAASNAMRIHLGNTSSRIQDHLNHGSHARSTG